MDEYERLKAQKEEMLKRHESAKDKCIADLETEVKHLRDGLREAVYVWKQKCEKQQERISTLEAALRKIADIIEEILDIRPAPAD